MFFVAYVNKNKCIGCKTCERYCPTGAIKVIEGKARVNWMICMGCGLCVRSCPRQAIRLVPRYMLIPPTWYYPRKPR
ncbi:MAG: 4Fe-4S binding protein [Candidatus Baldrarchaeia archaeon]